MAEAKESVDHEARGMGREANQKIESHMEWCEKMQKITTDNHKRLDKGIGRIHARMDKILIGIIIVGGGVLTEIILSKLP